MERGWKLLKDELEPMVALSFMFPSKIMNTIKAETTLSVYEFLFDFFLIEQVPGVARKWNSSPHLLIPL